MRQVACGDPLHITSGLLCAGLAVFFGGCGGQGPLVPAPTDDAQVTSEESFDLGEAPVDPGTSDEQVLGFFPQMSLASPEGAPTGLNAEWTGSGVVMLSWADRSSDETGFIVERQSAGSDWQPIATVEADRTAWEDSAVEPAIEYQYRVCAYANDSVSGDVTKSVYSNTVSVQVPPADSVLDTDQDGVPDSLDNCPAQANPDQADTDGDGIGDVCDSSPTGDSPSNADTGTQAEPLTAILTDTDGDGYADDVDNCPSLANPDQTDADGNGVGDACEYEYFVSPDGVDDTAPGRGLSESTPWKTIQYAIDRIAALHDSMPAGVILTLLPGEYYERLCFQDLSGTELSPFTIRAKVPGLATIRGDVLLDKHDFSFEPDTNYGHRFTFEATDVLATASQRVGKPLQFIGRVVELDTGLPLIQAPSLWDMDQFRRSYYYDESSDALYVHCTDGRDPDDYHQLSLSVIEDREARYQHGILVRNSRHIHFEGLVVRGFYHCACSRCIRKRHEGFGMYLYEYPGTDQTDHIVVRDCTFLYNGGGIYVSGADDVTIERNLLIRNEEPFWNESAQILVSGDAQRVSVTGNIVLDGNTYGIRFYAGPSDSTATGNIIRNAHIGLNFKAVGDGWTARYNVATECGETWNSPFYLVLEDHNTLAFPASWYRSTDPSVEGGPAPTTLLFQPGGFPWEADQVAWNGVPTGQRAFFVDPDHLDYRLQGVTDDGLKQAGAYPFVEGVVFFASPDGDDAHDGQSADFPKTAAGALDAADAGDTVYLLPGHYETLSITASGTDRQPIIIRGWGRGPKPVLAGLDLVGAAHLRIEDVHINGNFVIDSSVSDVVLSGCLVTAGSAEPAVVIELSRNIRLERVTLINDGAGAALQVNGAIEDISVTSSILKASVGPALEVGEAADPAKLLCEYNDYVTDGPSLARIPLDGVATDVLTLADLRAYVKPNRYALAEDPLFASSVEAPPDAIAPGSPCVGRGAGGGAIGSGEVWPDSWPHVIEADDTDYPGAPGLRQVTDTSASFTWWTPNTSSCTWRQMQYWYDPYPVLSKIRWKTRGEPAFDHEAFSYGDLYHRVTLHGLQPSTTYEYEIVIPDRPQKARIDGLPDTYELPVGWPEEEITLAGTFTTWAAFDPGPGTIYYVSPDGNGDGSETAPTNLTVASDLVRAGDTIICLDGTYTEAFIPAASGTAGHPITLRARNYGKVRFDGSGFTRPSGVQLMHMRNVVIDGIIFTRFAEKATSCRGGGLSGQCLVVESGEVTLQNCVFAGPGEDNYGVILRQTGDVHIVNNVFACHSYHVVGKSFGRVVLDRNTWYIPMISNIYLDAGNSGGTVTVTNNLFFGQLSLRTGRV